MHDYPLPGDIRESHHRQGDDLLTAGLGLAGLRQARKPAVDDPSRPTPRELRRRAIHASWRSSADLDPDGGFGSVYGTVPDIPGREYHAFASLPGARACHRVLLQAPDHFDHKRRCLVVTASPGSRGIYGGIALAGAWALPRGCAVVYTDKGAGSGYFDAKSGTGVRLDGTRAIAGEAALEFAPTVDGTDAGIAIKHAHSGDNPEARWGDHVLQAMDFGLAMLDRAYPDAAPFTPANTRIIATGLSNGASAVLRAAGADVRQAFDAVVAAAPNVLVADGGRAFYDYTCEIALWLGSALGSPSLIEVAKARHGNNLPDDLAWSETLADAGHLSSASPEARSQEALERLLAAGWPPAALQAALLTGDIETWRGAGAAYAGAYLRCPAGGLPGDERFEALVPDAQGRLHSGGAALRASWWPDAPGLPPSLGVVPTSLVAGQPLIESVLRLQALATGDDADACALRNGIDATAAALPHADLPLWIVHGEDDGLIPPAFSSLPYHAWLHAHGRHPICWHVPHVQHFDALLGWPALAARYLPLLPYAYAALDAAWMHLEAGQTHADDKAAPIRLPSRPRAGAPLSPTHLGLVAPPAT
ncbi:3-hydroxybutyrate oligomer hydrolase family protein [Acidihalobacter prosperus]|uniref:Hydrogenase n=1 Tax=Acidihalobacter prosperus TaxID=160660 RepID=A0A1A6C8I7_9GAMM|nr:3-hydroxybutyrate oligomer hydrolase family protein [Acidihalobacter prosperus]OBS10882.1 hypothetical protein Thpro_020598 [Acidihalobacter prosperus]